VACLGLDVIYVYFSGQQSLQVLLSLVFWRTIKSESAFGTMLWTWKLNVFYSTFTNVFYSCDVFYVF